jgi:hypothetical protein
MSAHVDRIKDGTVVSSYSRRAIMSLGDYASILYGLSTVSSRRTILSKPIVSSSDILVASIEMAFPTVSPMGREGKMAKVSPFSQPSDSSA